MAYQLSIVMISLSLLLGCSSSESPSSTQDIKYERIGGQGKFHFIYVQDNQSTDRDAYKNIAKAVCNGERVCIVMFWNDRSMVPRSLPMSDRQVDSKVAHYNLNKNTGLDRVLICAEDGC